MSNSTTEQRNNKINYDEMFGKRFGKLVVLGFVAIQDTTISPPHWKWLCQCDCGSFATPKCSNLRSGNSTSCGECAKGIDYDEMFDQRFGKLVVLGFLAMQDTSIPPSQWKWLVRCDCGGLIASTYDRLYYGRTLSCGCSRTGENHYRWIEDRAQIEHRERKEQWARDWSKAVYKRDNYTCQKCRKRGGKLNAHHLNSWTAFPELRIFLGNGVTLCKKCHYAFHGWIGWKKPSTLETYQKWMKEKQND